MIKYALRKKVGKMGLKLDSVAKECQKVSREIHDSYKELSLHFILYHEGQQLEALSLSAQQLVHHVAAEKAIKLMKSIDLPSNSSYLGTVIETTKILGGLSNIDALLSLCCINVDQFSSLNELKAYAYHLAWHGIHAAEARKETPYKERKYYTTMRSSRNLIKLSIANLRADTFSALVCAANGDKQATTKIAALRGNNALDKFPFYKPETYPFVLAMEATQFAISEYMKKYPHKRKKIRWALNLSKEIVASVELASIKHWLAFSEPAQEMAWQGYSKEEILGSAIYVSHNTHVRATGHLVSELTQIEPVHILETKLQHSAYAADKLNEALHNKTIDKIFEDVIAQSLIECTIDPFITEANRQNEELSNGKIIGWCASALQAAAVSFEKTLGNGRANAEKAARSTFDKERSSIAWEQLKQFGKELVRNYRIGKEMTYENIIQTCDNNPNFAPVLNSVQLTINDPSYIKELSAAADLDQVPAPVKAAPKAAPTSPANTHQLLPSLGLGGRGKSVTVPKEVKEAKEEETQISE
jgi:hypothetical protein